MSYPDVEGAVKACLVAANVCGGRVFFGVPSPVTESTFPLATVQRVGGGDDPGEAPLDLALIQIDVWGRKDAAGHTDKAAARAEANAVRTALGEIRGATALSPTVTAYGAAVESDLWAPDPSDRGRYVITALVTARAAVPA